ncbi:MAG: YjiH family protein [Spirochaetes bacterium]|nr:YjiH family protein [Spirochaetota bacterium]
MTEKSGAGFPLKFIFGSALGVFFFFVPVSFPWLNGGVSTIPVDHIVTFIRGNALGAARIYALFLMYAGAILPFKRKTWNADRLSVFFTVSKCIGAIVGTVIFFDMGREAASLAWLWRPDFGPFLFNILAIPVGLVIPIGAVFLAFLTTFGLMEFIAVFLTPIMRPVFKTPGRSAIDAATSFVASYSIAFLVTNEQYVRGKYSFREAAINATGFATVSITFLVVVANTLQLMEHWGAFFGSVVFTTFAAAAVTARIPPISKMPDTYYTGKGDPEVIPKGNLLKNAWNAGVNAAEKSGNLGGLFLKNIKDGFNMAFAVIPSITAIGLIGLVLAEYTPVFDILGFIFWPIFRIFGFGEMSALAGKAAALSLPEMFLPALLVAGEESLRLRFVVGVVSLSAVLFFSASIPCLLGTEIKIKLHHILIIWFQRVVVSILLAIPIAMLLGFPL